MAKVWLYQDCDAVVPRMLMNIETMVQEYRSVALLGYLARALLKVSLRCSIISTYGKYT